MALSQFIVPTKKINFSDIFLLSDIHLGVRANSVEWIENTKSFFYDFYIPYLKKNVKKDSLLFIIGDVFDSRQYIDINVLNTSIDIIIDIAEILPIHILIGNHDCAKKYDTDINSIVAFKYIPNVYIYEKPIIITNGTSNILVMPWIGNPEIEENYVRANKFQYLFAHTEINGFKYDNGKDIITSTNLKEFTDIKRIFSGHIHKRQEAYNIIYIGSPYHTKRSDIGNTKGLYLFKPDSNNISFTQNDHSPIFQRIQLQDILELSLSDTIKILNNNYTDIIVPDKYINLFNLTKFIDILKECKYKKIETLCERKRLEDELSGLEEMETRDILTLLDTNISELGHQAEALVKLKLLNRRYYERASHEDVE